MPEVKRKYLEFSYEADPVASGEFIPYREYIKTGIWKEKSENAKRAANWRCQLCNLGEEFPEDLTVLCTDCHRLFTENYN